MTVGNIVEVDYSSVDSMIATCSDDTQDTHTALEIKRVDFCFDESQRRWMYKDSDSNARPEAHLDIPSDIPNEKYCFFVVRRLPVNVEPGVEAAFAISIKSPHLLKACRDVMQYLPGISWTAQPLEVCSSIAS